jgi:MraZ protein
MTPGEQFEGIFDLTLDDRGRVPVPARYRQLFEREAVLALGIQGQAELWTRAGYDAGSVEFTQESMTTPEGLDLRRQRFAFSWPSQLDRQGRILVPAKLRELAELDGAVVVSGRGECLEIWNPQRWEETVSRLRQRYPSSGV